MALPDELFTPASAPIEDQIRQADRHVYQYDFDKKTWRVLNPTWDYAVTFAKLDFGTSSYDDLKATVKEYLPQDLKDCYGSVRDVPQVLISRNYTFQRTNSGKHLYRPSTDTTARTWTIPLNSSVAFPIGAVITIINGGTGAITVAPTSGVTLKAFTTAAVTGNRTLAASGMATLLKVEADIWFISGTGMT